MANRFQFKRGIKKDLPKLSPAELAFTTDEKSLYVGEGNENIRLLDQKDKLEITSLLSEKAKENELVLERNRIDNIVTIGSNTDNIETADVRIGFNGKRYASAGESVRSLGSDLLTYEKSENQIDSSRCIDGYYISGTGALVAASGYYLTDYYIQVSPGQKLLATYNNGSFASAEYCAYTMDKQFLNKTSISAGASTHLYTVPENCYWVKIFVTSQYKTRLMVTMQDNETPPKYRLYFDKTKLKRNSIKEVEGIKEYIDPKLTWDFLIGDLANGFDNVNPNRLITKDIIYADRDYLISHDWTTYRIYLWEYSDKNFSNPVGGGWKTADFTITKGKYFRLVIARQSNETPVTDTYGEAFEKLNVSHNRLIKNVFESSPIKNEDAVSFGNKDSYWTGIAHMLGANYAPENTLSALKISKRKGYNYAEFDIQKTSDGKFVLCHDLSVKVLANGAVDLKKTSQETGTMISIASTTLSQLKTYDFGSWFSTEFAGERIPTLEETLLLCKRLNVIPVLEVKYSATLADIQSMIAIVRQYGMLKESIWACYFATQQGYLDANLPDGSNLMVVFFGSLDKDWAAVQTKINSITKAKPIIYCEPVFWTNFGTNILTTYPDLELVGACTNNTTATTQALAWMSTPVKYLMTNGLDLKSILEVY